ncbi:MAG: DUF4296 domain-containing protein [Rikenellaceae bacterium]|nr:DUF4296 domain-containing protein [Rikenellaceae bacterium]
MTLLKKYIKAALAVFTAALLCWACSGPKTIPDRKLREIFKEVFIANAYMQVETIRDPARDSLDIYRPILGKYDYTMKDLEHTLANFSKRKSVRISQVVDQAIRELEEEESWYRYRASLLDTIDTRAQCFYARDIVRDSSFRARRIADTARLHLTLPVVEGIYDISYYYLLDSTDTNRSLKATFEVRDTEGKTTHTNTNYMSARRRTKVDMRVAAKEGDSVLTIRLGNYPANLTTPNLTVDSLRIEYKPTVGAALDSLDARYLLYKNRFAEWGR